MASAHDLSDRLTWFRGPQRWCQYLVESARVGGTAGGGMVDLLRFEIPFRAPIVFFIEASPVGTMGATELLNDIQHILRSRRKAPVVLSFSSFSFPDVERHAMLLSTQSVGYALCGASP